MPWSFLKLKVAFEFLQVMNTSSICYWKRRVTVYLYCYYNNNNNNGNFKNNNKHSKRLVVWTPGADRGESCKSCFQWAPLKRYEQITTVLFAVIVPLPFCNYVHENFEAGKVQMNGPLLWRWGGDQNLEKSLQNRKSIGVQFVQMFKFGAVMQDMYWCNDQCIAVCVRIIRLTVAKA